MTMGCPEFDGDSHESSAHWFGMTMLFDALTFLYKFPISRLLRNGRNHYFNRREAAPYLISHILYLSNYSLLQIHFPGKMQ